MEQNAHFEDAPLTLQEWDSGTYEQRRHWLIGYAIRVRGQLPNGEHRKPVAHVAAESANEALKLWSARVGRSLDPQSGAYLDPDWLDAYEATEVPA